MYKKVNLQKPMFINDKWNIPSTNLKSLPFSLNIGNDWVAKSFNDIEGNLLGCFYKPFGDTIQYSMLKGFVNLKAIEKTTSMCYFENLVLDGNNAKIFKENNNWVGYYMHNDSLFNFIKVENVQDEIFIMNLLRNYKIR